MVKRLDPKKAEAAIAWLEYKKAVARRPNGAWLQKRFARLARKVSRRLKAQMRWVVAETRKLPQFANEGKAVRYMATKTASSDIDIMLDDLPERDYLAEDVVAQSRPAYKKGAVTIQGKMKMAEYGVRFDLVNEDAVKWLKERQTVLLSDYKGTITDTTKKKISKLILDAVQNGKTYAETAKLIESEGDAGVFSDGRAELISVTEIGDAYIEGQAEMTRKFADETGLVVWKAWLNVDNDLDDECDDNNRQGWIENDEVFSSGDDQPLAHPRCLCDLVYQALTPEEGKPDDSQGPREE